MPLVVIGSPSAPLRSRWKRGIEDGFLVHEVGRQNDLERVMAGMAPDILLLDLTLARPGGLAVAAAVQRLSPRSRIVLLTSAPNDREGVVALKAGAKGYCGRDISPSLLKRAVETVRGGGIWVGHSVVPCLLEELASLAERPQETSLANSGSRLDQLTRRERQIARLIESGASNKEIAARLHICNRTVKSHLTAIYRKLECADRLRLAVFVVGGSLVTPACARHRDGQEDEQSVAVDPARPTPRLPLREQSLMSCSGP